MPLIPLDLPAGIYRNGTDLEASNRWRDANLIRWRNNTMGPVGGWRERFPAVDGISRGMFAWEDNTQDRWLAIGTRNKLYVNSASNIQYDITPAGLTAGIDDAGVNIGYSGGFYGFEEYGIARQDVTTIQPATTWALDQFGENLIACSSSDGVIYEWTLNTGTPAAPVANAPTGNASVLVTAERFLFALGAGGNPKKIQWSDREDNTTWTPVATNEAGDFILQTEGNIMAGFRVQGQTLIITEVDAHVATYVGPPFVYGFERVGTSCGMISNKAGVVTDAGAIWMGRSAFFIYTGGRAQEVSSDISDYIFSDINTGQRSKVYAVVNSKFSEVWWFYPSSDSIENNRYAVYNFSENTWSIGELARSAGIDSGAFKQPIWFDPTDLKAYEHEIGFFYSSLSPYAESGPISLGTGDNVLVATDLIPDERTQGEVTAIFKTRFHPNDVERSYGPYTMSTPTSVRFTGRQIRMRVDGVENNDWRVGIMRLEAKQGGRR